jgi:CheY-like chemotaxis protein
MTTEAAGRVRRHTELLILVRFSSTRSTDRPSRRVCAWLPGLALAASISLAAPAAFAGNADRVVSDENEAAVTGLSTSPAWMRLFGILLISAAGAGAVRAYDIRKHRQLEQLVAKRTEQLTAEIEERRRAAVEREAAREAALQASRLMSEFLVNVSHEIRTPMNGVLKMIDRALQMPLPAEARRYLEQAQSSAHLLRQAIDDVLDLSKVEAGKLHILNDDTRLDGDQPQETVPRPLRVLVADDNAISRTVTERILQGGGHIVALAENGLQAMEMTLASRFDLVLMDVQMPEMDGLAATVAIRREEPAARRTPIVGLTAHAFRGDRDRCIDAGMDDYVAKPVRREELEAALRRALRHSSSSTLSSSQPSASARPA